MDYNVDAVNSMVAMDFNKCAVWHFDEDDDLYHPMESIKDAPEYGNTDFTYIRARLSTLKGLKFDGFICGIREEDMYVIGIYVHEQLFLFNKNLRKFCEEDFKKIQRIFSSKKLKDLHDLFPLHFRTDFHLDDFKNFEGEFDIFKPGRDIKEKLSEIR